MTDNTRVVHGSAAGALGAAFALRALGDVGDGRLSWLSPIGLAQKSRPFAGERWWPLLILVLAAVGVGAGAVALARRRDLGGGLLAARRGPSRGSAGLGTPLGVAARLQRATIAGWAVGVLLVGAAYGSVAQDVDDLIGGNDTLAEIISRGVGGSLTDAYLGTSTTMLAVIASGFAVSSALRLRTEEDEGRAEPLVATGIGRGRWAVSHLAVTVAGSVVVLLAAGLGEGVAYGIASGDAGQVVRLVAAALAYTPAVGALTAVAVLLFGVLPRWAPLAWAAFGACVAVSLLGEVLDVPPAIRDLSPYEAVPHAPVESITAGPLLALSAVATALAIAGLAGFRRRDIG